MNVNFLFKERLVKRGKGDIVRDNMKNTFAPIKSHKELGITKWQWLNLIRLTLFVRDSVPPPKFDIHSFNSESIYDASGASYECGTTACFCGYGPLAGIRPKPNEAWNSYGARVFGAGAGSWATDQRVRDLYELLFAQDHKNSKLAAIRRGAYFLMNGFPNKTFFVDLTEWETPKSFKDKINWKGMEQILKDNS